MEISNQTHSIAVERTSAHEQRLIAMGCLRCQCQAVLQDSSALGASLLRRDHVEGLHALERLCLGLFVIDQLITLLSVSTGAGPGEALERAKALRARTIQRVLPGLAAAHHDLPGAPEVMRSFLELAREPGPRSDGGGA